MSEPYLLAATLLTGVPISASPIPDLPPIQPNNLSALSDTTKFLPPILAQKIVPSVEISLPEFSTAEIKLALDQPLATNFKPDQRKLASGSQLYQQRLAALKAGKIYTRLAEDSFESSWVKATRKPTYEDWKRLLAQEAKAIALGQGGNSLNILVGDSLSLWFPTEKLPSGKFWLNQGISGDTSSGILKRLSAFAQTRPNTIYILAGINDLKRGATDTAILNNHRQIIRRLRQTHPQAEIIVQSILPTRMIAIPNSRIRQLNQKLAIIAQQQGANYLNLHGFFTDSQGNLQRDLTTDGLHLSQRGYEVWHLALQQREYQIATSRTQRSPIN